MQRSPRPSYRLLPVYIGLYTRYTINIFYMIEYQDKTEAHTVGLRFIYI